jgi:transposase-like protein
MQTPIELVLEVMKPEEVAAVCGVNRTTVYYWRDNLMRGGETGLIPSKYIRPLYEHLTKNSLGISLERLCGIPPRKRSGKKSK